MADDDEGGEIFGATKNGATLEFSRDPHPGTDRYLVIDAPGMLVLLPKNGPEAAFLEPVNEQDRGDAAPDHDRQLRAAFTALGTRVSDSVWSRSDAPKSVLATGFRALADQPHIRDDVRAYLAANPSVASAAEMLFTSIAMSARADWCSTPARVRGVAARGWFLGRWIPTFLVLDGPILRFLNSPAFRRQTGSPEFLRAVRSFFHAQDFMALRHGFAHWSFTWVSNGNDSEIVVHGRASESTVRVSRREVDAFHILTFAVVEAVHDVFLRVH
jgi:hypothetical protein